MQSKENSSLLFLSPLFAGAVASLVTQPFQVIKTNRINSPSLVYLDLHSKIVRKGWRQYMRGSSLAVIRQAYGFAIYTKILDILEKKVVVAFPSINKFANYSFSAVTAKLIAMVFEAPLTLLKTRVECVEGSSVSHEIKYIVTRPLKQSLKGLGTSILREILYTVFHYNTYRYFKDEVYHDKLYKHSIFMPAFIAGLVALIVSQPFQVLRSLVTLNKQHKPILNFTSDFFYKHGVRGFFLGFTPRLIRKPINSGICWSIYETFRQVEDQQ